MPQKLPCLALDSEGVFFASIDLLIFSSGASCLVGGALWPLAHGGLFFLQVASSEAEDFWEEMNDL